MLSVTIHLFIVCQHLFDSFSYVKDCLLFKHSGDLYKLLFINATDMSQYTAAPASKTHDAHRFWHFAEAMLGIVFVKKAE